MQSRDLNEIKAARLVVRGKVQGVWFRASTEKEANRLGVTGWVRNCPDRTVEILAEGAELEEFIAWCRQGPPLAEVDAVDIEWTTPRGFDSFEIR
ncbi:MAG: acylphosphatase [Candidatus Nitronauta litoralis]|uniref:acylphosphatase n=1 Tax=Candidatus Nitronauta litoralis TaxID=2705533 RepID=A0A7T0FYZ6_9BACT|nr:MAG: acylphosphatase [Candidatus Nitronauta litoralis]